MEQSNDTGEQIVINGTFAIYPAVDSENVAEHAVIFCDDSELAGELCRYFTSDRGVRHLAFLRLPSWPDPQLIQNLNGCSRVAFSIRHPKSAADASAVCRHLLGDNA